MQFRLADEGRAFSTRARGARTRSLVLDLLDQHEQVDVDFSDVLMISYSFADEFVGKLFTEHPACAVHIVSMNEEVERTITKSLSNRGIDLPFAVA